MLISGSSYIMSRSFLDSILENRSNSFFRLVQNNTTPWKWTWIRTLNLRFVKNFIKHPFFGKKKWCSSVVNLSNINIGGDILETRIFEEFWRFATYEKGGLWYSLLLTCFSQNARILIVILINQPRTIPHLDYYVCSTRNISKNININADLPIGHCVFEKFA